MNHSKQTIGNQGVPRPRQYQARTHAYPYYRGYANPEYVQSSSFSGYPGLGGSQLSSQLGANLPAALPSQTTFATQAGSGGGGALSGLASLFGGSSAASGASGSSFNLAQLKTVVDRLGGIEGIVDTFGKVQKMVAGVQQMAPMIKLLLGTFGKGKKAADNDEDGDGLAPIGRRRRKRKNAPNARRRKRRR
ncbi:hypothetical protein ACFQI7_25835 [Paenibacillus allorhizosphaerae]|uniref:Tyrosine protein kinase n=1 Tax=Paenibacillus allorhizosphaerae TaxID=2849866 RepID=A0ABN7TLH8_9BACL|nr:hypothetical protein [Paenibacillus allorhizosphaerae]CAG7645548.1 hypothetical protein PAECIP111802_03543 [Paenibacillus allorhizosphaerae]